MQNLATKKCPTNHIAGPNTIVVLAEVSRVKHSLTGGNSAYRSVTASLDAISKWLGHRLPTSAPHRKRQRDKQKRLIEIQKQSCGFVVGLTPL